MSQESFPKRLLVQFPNKKQNNKYLNPHQNLNQDNNRTKKSMSLRRVMLQYMEDQNNLLKFPRNLSNLPIFQSIRQLLTESHLMYLNSLRFQVPLTKRVQKENLNSLILNHRDLKLLQRRIHRK